MHVAAQLFIDSFQARIDGDAVEPAEVFPEWRERDVFGIVIDEPLGALGASLLMQLSIANFYEVKPERRSEVPAYPDFYLFHVGGRQGDFSYFDYWPPRREVFLPAASSPLTLLEELNTRGITRLALPDGPLGDPSLLGAGPNTWAEQGAAIDRLKTCLLYDPSGEVAGGAIELSSQDPRVFENIVGTLDPRPTFEADRALAAEIAAADPSAPLDVDALRWADIAEPRFQEISAAERGRVKEQIERRHGTAGGGLHESYALITSELALARIAGLVR